MFHDNAVGRYVRPNQMPLRGRNLGVGPQQPYLNGIGGRAWPGFGPYAMPGAFGGLGQTALGPAAARRISRPGPMNTWPNQFGVMQPQLRRHCGFKRAGQYGGIADPMTYIRGLLSQPYGQIDYDGILEFMEYLEESGMLDPLLEDLGVDVRRGRRFGNRGRSRERELVEFLNELLMMNDPYGNQDFYGENSLSDWDSDGMADDPEDDWDAGFTIAL
ncbi:hypothetical protein LTR50_004920 [Elasticomyces elasticus]|nr:hypothetical protein LTR50_004920 [Elasticomyces elasticus]